MQRYIPPEAERYGKRNHRRSIWKKIVSGLACVVVFCTTYALILPAITQERETYCGQEAHKHDESCYTQTSTAKTMVCTPETPCVHTHSELCYDAAGTLVCQLPEVSQHEHTDSCYAPAETAVPVLHTHSDVCYTQEQGELQCQLEESEEHTHTADCYTWNSVLTCGMEEGEVEPTTAAEPVLICTEPVLAVHEHTESCFETATEDTLSCGKEEHEHDLSCYSNPEADLETAEDWEAAFQDVELSGVWTQDVLAIAKTQLGYTESTSNYTVNEDGTTNGYTRYGAWYGKPYDDWCAMFVSFCLDYAGVEDMPLNANCEKWIEALAAKDCGLYQAAGTHEPQSGELIFFDNNGDGISDHVGLVAEIIEATDTEPAQIRTIEGNSSNRVQYVTYELDDAAILGYASLPSQLTEEEQATVDYVISLIDAVPSADEIDAKMVQFEDAEDYEGEEAWLTEVYQQVYDAYYRYNRLSDTQKDYVTNADKLLELQFIWDRMTYALTNELSIYQINAYYPENGYDASCYAAMLIWGGSFDSQVQLSWMMDMPFNYWDAVVVDKDADGNYYIKQYDVSTNDKSTLVAPDNGFVLIYTTDKTHSFWLSDLDIKVGDYVTISSTIQNFNYKNYSGDYDEDNTTNGQYNGSAYCTITFSSEKSDSSTTVTGTNDVDVVKAVSTKDFIELNLYDYYGSASASANGKLDINTKWDTTPNASDGTIQKDSTKKEYLGFQWNGGAYAYLRTPSTSTVPNGTKLVDRNVVDNIDFGNSVITDYEFKAGDYGSPSATSQKAAYGNSEGWGRINRIEVDQYGWGITCRPIGMSTLKDRTSGTIYNEVLERTLNADGYPQLAALDYEEGQGSLEYLFSENDYAKKVNSGTIDGLFQYDETTGMYSYNSRQNHAQYNAETETFTLYKQIITPNFILYPFGNFLPFNDITDSATSTLVGGDNDTAGAGSAYIERIMNRLRSSDNFSNYTYTTYNYTTEEQLYNMLEEYKNNWGSYDYKTTTVPEATDTTAEGTYTRYILKVVGNVTVTHKGNVPTVTKVIVEGDDEKKASDAAVGDTVTFKLTATLPSDYDYYKAYQLIFNDTLSTGLTYNGDAKVYLDSVADTYEITSNFTIAPDAAQTTGGGNLTITCTNLKNVTGVTNSSKIIVEYTATLNSGAVVGPNGNPNTVKLNYSNNPNDDGTGTTSTGETPEDKVIVFTYELDVTKIDGVDENIKLEGVEFKLYRKNSDNANEYAIVNNNKITGWTTTKANGTTLTTDGDGQIKIAGLDSATYYLEETKARDGYNLPDDPFEVVISADVTETGITDLSATIGGSSGSADKTTGVVSGTIENNSGATLPETGGIGTTIFYVLGGVMVLAAAVLLVTKKRMSAAE